MVRHQVMLLTTSPPTEWQTALSSYDDAITAHAKTSKRRSGLKELDEFVRVQLPRTAASRVQDDDDAAGNRGWMIKDEVCKIVQWKITVSISQ